MPYLDVDDITLYYEDEGTGPALLFLHGWGTSGLTWGAQLPDFTRDHRVVTLDWRGCGRSDRPVRGNIIAEVVGDLVALIGALRLDRPVVVGSSMGAVFAAELAVQRPELIGGVVAVGGPGYWPTTKAQAQAELVADLRRDRAGTVAGWVPKWYAPGTSPALIDWTVRQILDSGVYIDEHQATAVGYDPRPTLPGLQVPIHYIHGELDAIPLEVARTCAALTPGAEVTAIVGSGHLPHQELPDEFNAALRAALARMAPAARAVA
ncbi:alpha/beta hydrolase [Streptomyces sp. NPDC048506]|uniref:alpha/beta fold hydrolase n=1 Tax=Streptomyces sp. NPDC048506 TaxID=3155028 RepID=UPI003439CCF2